MVTKIIAQNERIVIGTDVHDMKHNVAVVDSEGKIVRETAMPAHRRSWENLLKKLPGCQVVVVYEAGPHGYNLHDLVEELGHKCVVVAPCKHVGIKTDKRDARAIARDYRAGRASLVTVPSFEKRVRRQLTRTRESLKKEVRKLKNQINGIQRFHGMGGKGLEAVRHDETGYVSQAINALYQAIADIEDKVKDLEKTMKEVSKEKEYNEDFKTLKGITGVGEATALEVILGVADIRKFSKSKQFSSYLGLCPGEWSSGNSRRLGHISKRGPGRLRGILVQCAWVRVRYDEKEKHKFAEQSKRLGKRRAIVAAARRLAVHIWWSLKESTPQAA